MSLTVSLIAVLIPLLFMGDVVGRLFREFAVTLGVTILISAVVSLTLTPMMCARLLRHTPAKRAGPLLPRVATRVRSDRSQAYGRTLAVGARASDGHVARGGGDAGADRAAVHRRAKGILSRPGYRRDSRRSPKRRRSISFAAMAERQQALGQRSSSQDPAVESLSSFIGVDGTNTTLNSGRMLINLKPLASATRAPATSSAGCSRSSPTVEGITLFLQPVQDLTVEDRVSRTQYQYSLEDADPDGAGPVGAQARRAPCRRCPSCAT